MSIPSASASDTTISGAVIDMPNRLGYVSCIKIDGKPILPPIMTEMKRAEMRHYRDLAVGVENSLRYLKKCHQEQKQAHPSAVPLNTTVTIHQETLDEAMDALERSVDEASASFMKILNDIAAEDVMENVMFTSKPDLAGVSAQITAKPVTKHRQPSNRIPDGVHGVTQHDSQQIESETDKVVKAVSSPKTSRRQKIEETGDTVTAQLNASMQPEKSKVANTSGNCFAVDSNTKIPVNVTTVIETVEEEGISDVSNDGHSYFDEHFVVKKGAAEEANEWEMFEQEGSSSEYSSAESDLHSSVLPNIGSANSEAEKCPRVQDDDKKKEAMSLISLDTEEEKIRQAIIQGIDDEAGNRAMEEHILENDGEPEQEGITTGDQCSEGELSDYSIENYDPGTTSGRSSTETFIIERHDPSDVRNNNGLLNTTRRDYFSPIQPTRETTVFASDEAPLTIKARQYFDSPPSVSQIPSKQVEAYRLAELPMDPSRQNMSNVLICLSPSTTSTNPHIIENVLGACKKLVFDDEPEKDNSIALSNRSVQCQTSNDVSEISSTTLTLDHASENLTPSNILNTTITKALPLATSKVQSKQVDTNHPSKPSKIPLSPSKLNAVQHSTPKQNVKASKRMSRRAEINQAKNLQVKVNKNKNTSALPPASAPVVVTPEVRVPKPPVNQPLAGVNLATLQLTMQAMSPSFFKAPSDARSPLLKGVMFLDPLLRPQRELRIPPEDSDPIHLPKFCKLTAAAKGFLVRRLLRTEKLQMIIQTIKDTVELVLKLYEEVPQLKIRGAPGVKPEDAELCQRLFQQLTGACQSFHDVFFKLTTQQRMAIIASDREKIKAKELKAYLARTVPARLSQSVRTSMKGGKQKVNRNSINTNIAQKRKLSTATVKSIQRRMSVPHV